jgi:hypothetical protein
MVDSPAPSALSLQSINPAQSVQEDAMSRDEFARTPQCDLEDTPRFGRRAMIEHSTLGVAAMAASLLGLSDVAFGQSAQRPAGAGATTRRIVSGQNADGKSVIAKQDLVEVSSLWTTSPEELLGSPATGEPKQVSRLTGQTRAWVASIQPSKDPKPSLTNRIGFHRTPGIAYCYMISGEVFYMVDLEEIKVTTGELIVERYTMHSWRNEGTEPATMFIVLINANA